MTAPTKVITGIRTVSVPVTDQDQALRFYVDTLGFTVLRDGPIPTGGGSNSRPATTTSSSPWTTPPRTSPAARS